MSNESDRVAAGNLMNEDHTTPASILPQAEQTANGVRTPRQGQNWEERYRHLLTKFELLDKELQTVRAERDQLRKSLAHYVRYEFPEITMTKEELMAECGKNKQTIEELIGELDRQPLEENKELRIELKQVCEERDYYLLHLLDHVEGEIPELAASRVRPQPIISQQPIEELKRTSQD